MRGEGALGNGEVNKISGKEKCLCTALAVGGVTELCATRGAWIGE